jgi:hypothetical protein
VTRYKTARQISLLTLLALVVFAGCSTSDDESSDATSTTGQATATRPPALSSVSGQTISDGLCQVTIPDGWVDDGTGRGNSAGGHRFELFGGRVTNDAAWQAVSQVVATPRAGRTIAAIEQNTDSVHAIFDNDEGFAYRARFDTIYCDFSVTSMSGPIAESERAAWPEIIGSIAPSS